jgi:PAS domain-containing protein
MDQDHNRNTVPIIKALMQRLGWKTQRELGKKVGAGETMISRHLNGLLPISFEWAQNYARWMNDEERGNFWEAWTDEFEPELASALLDGYPVASWRSDANNLVIWVSRGWLDITGQTFEQVMREGWQDRVHRADLKRILRINQMAIGQQKGFTYRYRLKRADGKFVRIFAKANPQFSDGLFVGFKGSCIVLPERYGVCVK